MAFILNTLFGETCSYDYMHFFATVNVRIKDVLQIKVNYEANEVQ